MKGVAPGAAWDRGHIVLLTAAVYTPLVFALPFASDLGPPTVLLMALWLGGSFLAGFLVPWRRLAIVPVVATIVFTVIVIRGSVDSEFLSDSFSLIGIAVLGMGELGALFFGSDVARSRKGANR